MKTRIGTVLVFKDGVTPEEAERRLMELQDILHLGYYLDGKIHINEYDPCVGGPVWYVP